MIEVRSQDHKLIYSNLSSTRFRESFVPQYTAYRKAFTNLAKSEHHLSVLSDFKHSKRIFKAFKSRIKPLVQNTTLELTIKWEQTIENIGRMPFSTLVNHRPLQAQENIEKLSDRQLIINEILQEQIQLIYSSTDTFIILCKNIPHGDGIEATKWHFQKKRKTRHFLQKCSSDYILSIYFTLKSRHEIYILNLIFFFSIKDILSTYTKCS